MLRTLTLLALLAFITPAIAQPSPPPASSLYRLPGTWVAPQNFTGGLLQNGVPIASSAGPNFYVTGITANTSLGTLPADGFLGPMLILEETANHATTVSIGTTSGASDVLAAQSVPANGTLTVDITAFSKGWFSSSSTQQLFLTTTGGGSSIKAQLFYWILGTPGGVGGGGGGGAASLTLGTTTISGGANGRIEYNNAGVLGELAVTGSGNAVLATSPSIVSANLNTPSAINLTNATAVPATQLTGIVGTTHGGAGATIGALKGDGAGIVSRAACADLSNAGTACTQSTGTSGAVIPLLNGNNAWTAGQGVTPVALTPGATVTPNAALSNNFTLAAAQSFTLANPTNLKAGQTLNFWITQDVTGSRVASWGSQYQAAGGSGTLVLSTAASAKDIVSCQADTATSLTCSIQTGVTH
jgi:hypothetical protein